MAGPAPPSPRSEPPVGTQDRPAAAPGVEAAAVRGSSAHEHGPHGRDLGGGRPMAPGGGRKDVRWRTASAWAGERVVHLPKRNFPPETITPPEILWSGVMSGSVRRAGFARQRYACRQRFPSPDSGIASSPGGFRVRPRPYRAAVPRIRLISAKSQARAYVQSRRAVGSEMSRTSAASLNVRPTK